VRLKDGKSLIEKMIVFETCEYECMVLTARTEEEALYVQDEKVDSKYMSLGQCYCIIVIQTPKVSSFLGGAIRTNKNI
jgi:hypothetical protein